jgi:hypothetical protein
MTTLTRTVVTLTWKLNKEHYVTSVKRYLRNVQHGIGIIFQTKTFTLKSKYIPERKL